MVKWFVLAIGFLSVGNALAKVLPPLFNNNRPKLVVVLVIDQFRPDNISRFASRFLPAKDAKGVGGFRYLLENSAYFPQAKYSLLQNMTAPGHATIMTGAYPYRNGVPTNMWLDRQTGKMRASIEDAEMALVGEGIADNTVGASPRVLLAPTITDEWKNLGHPSKIISISLKDRSAILLGGRRADLATWFDTNTFKWVSSRYYLPDGKLPSWLSDVNAGLSAQRGKTWTWQVAGKPTGYATNNDDILLDEREKEEIGASFPHKFTLGTRGSLASPFGLDIVESASEKAVEHYGLGKTTGATDFLLISLSSHDIVGHAFGPTSLENEEMVVAEDRTISKLLNFLRQRVPGGLAEVSLVLTADHGIPPNATILAKNKMFAGRIDETKLAETMESQLNEKFGTGAAKWIAGSSELGFYFNEATLKERKADREKVEETVREILAANPGMAFVLTKGDNAKKRLPHGPFGTFFMNSFFPERSADVVGMPHPYFTLNKITVDHMTGYEYDRTVPVMFCGRHFEPSTQARGEIVDIAPTLSYLLGIVPPALSEGRVLDDVFTAKPVSVPSKTSRRKAAR